MSLFKITSSEDVDTEISALSLITRKLWSGLRTLWRNSPHASNDQRVQSLKFHMRRNEDDSHLHQTCAVSISYES